MRISCLVLLTSLTFLWGCASGFEQNYHPVQNPIATSIPLKRCATPKVEKLGPHANIKGIKESMLADGYVLIGEARWESINEESNETAMEQGQKVGACLVLWRRADAGILHTTRTVTDYTPAHTTTVKVKNKHGHSTKTIDVPAKTTYHEEPVDYQRYEYMGLFFAKLQGGGEALGIESASPSTQYMAKHDSRRGIMVVEVTPHGAAYNANIFPGDVILKLNGQDVTFGSPLRLIPHEENILLIDRNGKQLTKKIVSGAGQSYM